MSGIKEKLLSRKFIASMIGVIVGIAVVFGIDGNTITNIAGLVTTLASLVTYIWTEGKIDAEAVNAADMEFESNLEIEDEMIADIAKRIAELVNEKAGSEEQ